VGCCRPDRLANPSHHIRHLTTRPVDLPDVDLSSIADDKLRALVTSLLNLVQHQATAIDQLRTENQALRAEVARLKGQPPRPRFPDPPAKPDPSSENERKKHGPRGPFFVHTLRAELRRGRVGVVAVGDVPVAARRGARPARWRRWPTTTPRPRCRWCGCC
jgi:hypothetical protein